MSSNIQRRCYSYDEKLRIRGIDVPREITSMAVFSLFAMVEVTIGGPPSMTSLVLLSCRFAAAVALVKVVVDVLVSKTH